MNYFNYFTEIEDHFQRKRGAQVWLSPVDWALIASWQAAGVPLAAVLAGIDRAFEKFESGRRGDTQRRRALVYCSAAVMEANAAMQAAALGATPAESGGGRPVDDAFAPERVRAHLRWNLERLGDDPKFEEVRRSLATALAADPLPPLEDLDRLLTVLDDKIVRALEDGAGVDELVALRGELDRELAPYRRTMRAEQVAMIERQFLQRRLLERAGLKRLSLFYLED